MSLHMRTICARCDAECIDTAARGHRWFVRHLVDDHGVVPLAAHIAARLKFAKHVADLEQYLSERRAA
jgi:hypothetical protein